MYSGLIIKEMTDPNPKPLIEEVKYSGNENDIEGIYQSKTGKFAKYEDISECQKRIFEKIDNENRTNRDGNAIITKFQVKQIILQEMGDFQHG